MNTYLTRNSNRITCTMQFEVTADDVSNGAIDIDFQYPFDLVDQVNVTKDGLIVSTIGMIFEQNATTKVITLTQSANPSLFQFEEGQIVSLIALKNRNIEEAN